MKRLLTELAKRCPGQQLPDSYLVFDTETSGADPAKDKILQYGFAVVIDGKLVDSFGVIANRGRDCFIHPKAIEVHGIDHDRMEREGVDPKLAFDEVVSTFEAYRERGWMFVGHNAIRFDAELFENECKHWGHSFCFKPDEIFDTGMVVKAAQLGMYIDPRHTIRSWARRVSNVRAKGVYWSLDRYCFKEFKLSEFDLSAGDAHDAGYDCRITHFLLQRFKEWV